MERLTTDNLVSSYLGAKLQADYESYIVVAPDFTYGDASNNSLLLFESELTMHVEASDGVVITGRLPGYTIVVDCPNLPYIRVPINLCVLAYVFCSFYILKAAAPKANQR